VRASPPSRGAGCSARNRLPGCVQTRAVGLPRLNSSVISFALLRYAQMHPNERSTQVAMESNEAMTCAWHRPRNCDCCPRLPVYIPSAASCAARRFLCSHLSLRPFPVAGGLQSSLKSVAKSGLVDKRCRPNFPSGCIEHLSSSSRSTGALSLVLNWGN